MLLFFFPTCSSSCVSGVPLYICNDNIYGFVMVPLEQSDSLQLDFMQLINLKLEVLGMYVCNNSFTIIYKLHCFWFEEIVYVLYQCIGFMLLTLLSLNICMDVKILYSCILTHMLVVLSGCMSSYDIFFFQLKIPLCP
jgi:hypothetical protein